MLENNYEIQCKQGLGLNMDANILNIKLVSVVCIKQHQLMQHLNELQIHEIVKQRWG